jgi:Uma2 family endonuclease
VKKKDIYVEAGITEYWVVNLKYKRLQVFRDLKNGQYKTELPLTTGIIAPLAFLDVSVQVERLSGTQFGSILLKTP